MSKWHDKLRDMVGLGKGWNGYDADPPSDGARLQARHFLFHLHAAGVSPSRIAPSVVGGIGITCGVPGGRVYVEFYNAGMMLALFSIKGKDLESREFKQNSEGFEELASEIKGLINGTVSSAT
jgi:hypothetical protein